MTRGHEDNLYATPSDPESSLVTTVTPWLSATSDWQRHELRLRAGAERARYTGHSDEDYTDHYLRLDERYELRGGGSVFGSLSSVSDHEDRSAVDTPGTAAEPTEYDQTQAVLGTALPVGGVEVRGGLTATDLDFEDVPLTGGGFANNDDRNRQEYELGGRVLLRRDAGWRPFVQAAVNRRDYEDRYTDFGFQRSSDGASVAVGLARPLPGGSAELLVGHMQQDYDDPRFDRIEAWDAGARVETDVTPRTGVEVSFSRSIEETTLPGVAGAVDSITRATLDHRITRRFSASVPVYWVRSDYRDSDRTDDVTGVGLRLSYRLTPRLTLTGGHIFERRESNMDAADYQDATTYVGIDASLSAPPIRALRGESRSGAYVGVHGGRAFTSAEFSGHRGPASGNGSVDGRFGDFSTVAGGFVGYGWGMDRWLLALEAQIDKANGEWRHHRDERDFGSQRNERYGGGVRLGYWVNDGAMLYGHAGLSAAEFDTHYAHGGSMVSDTGTQRGVSLGTGMELSLTRRLFGRLEWRYTDYDGYDVDYGNGTDRFSPEASAITLGLGYRFFDAAPQRTVSRSPDVFTGPYVGAQLGWGSLHTDNRGDNRGQAGVGDLSAERAGDGGVAGVFGGYGARLGSLYLGVEAEAEHSEAGWDSARRPDRRIYSVDRGPTYGLGLRVGYLLGGNALVYARAGRVRAELDTDYRFDGIGVHVRDERDVWATRAGIGVEVPTSEHAFVRLDYTRTDYEDYSIRYDTGTETFDSDEDLFRIGLGYRF